MCPFVSVVIPVKDCYYTIRSTIESLKHQTRQPDEIVVVASRNATAFSFLKDYLDDPAVRIVSVDAPPSFMRDAQWRRWTGAKLSKGDVLFFTDSKVILHPQAIQRTLELMAEHRVMALAGIRLAWPDQSQHFLAKVQDKGLVTNGPRFPRLGFLNKENFGATEHLPVTTTLAITREAFQRIAGDFGIEFSLVSTSYDDYVLSWLLAKDEITILTTNQVIAYHRHRLTWQAYCKEIARSGQAAAVLLWKYPECPFGKRRFRQILALLGLSALCLGLVFLMAFINGPAPTLIGTIITLAGAYTSVGLSNAIIARDRAGFFIPAATGWTIGIFVLHYLKGWFKRGIFRPHELAPYLQTQ